MVYKHKYSTSCDKIIDLIQCKLSYPLEEIKGDKKVTIKTVISNCDIKDQNYIKWINIDNIIFSGIGGYVIKNLKNNKKTKMNINNPVQSPNGKFIIYTKLKKEMVYIYLFDYINNIKNIIMKYMAVNHMMILSFHQLNIFGYQTIKYY